MKERVKIRNPKDCLTLLLRYNRMKQEHFGVIFLNRQKEVIKTKCFFVGSDDACNVYPRIIFWKACKLEASAMILFHNHPSGNSEPSEKDIDLTQSIEKGGELLGIQVFDHIIVTKYNYFSFLERDLINQEETKIKAAEL